MKKFIAMLIILSIACITAITSHATVIQTAYKVNKVYFDKHEGKYYGHVVNPKNKKDTWEVCVSEKVFKSESKSTTKAMIKKFVGQDVVVIYENMETKKTQDDWIVGQFFLNEGGW